MSSPTPVRFEESQQKALKDAQKATGLKQADVVRLAVEELFKKYPTNAALVKAIILHRTAKAEKYDAAQRAVGTVATKSKNARARQ